MPVLAFKVQADYEKVVRLREEIHKLKEEMRGMDAVNSPHQFNTLNQKLKQCTSEYNNLTTAAVEAGKKIESGFKKKIYDAQQTVNGLSEEILKQKKIIADTSDDLRQLTNRYKELKHNGQNLAANAMLPQMNKVKAALDEEKRALFDLTQERAKSQLSVKKLKEEYALFAKESGVSFNILAKLKKDLLGLGTGFLAGMGLKELGSEIIRVRGQFQAADTAIQTLLGSKERADDLLAKVREYAKISPLEFGDITSATQMMLGFNIEAEKVPRFIKAIGDVSMGESSRFNSLTLAFSQMSATGKLMGQDLNQMINAGFNPLTIMAEKTGKSIAQLKDEMSKGAITAEMVQQAFIDATSEGGKFFNMSENAAKTINGQLSMMHDAIDSALNDIGKSSEGMIMTGISGITKLIESYETVGRVLLGLATTYGTYRTAVSLVTFAQNGHTLAMTMARAQILLTQKAQALLNATMLANPYVLAAVALGGLVGTVIACSDGLNAAEKAQRDFNTEIERAEGEQKKYNEETEKAINLAKNDSAATADRREAMQLLIDRYPSIIQKYIDEEGHLKNILQLKREIAEIDGKNTVASYQKDSSRFARYAEILDRARKAQQGGTKLTDGERKELEEAKKYYYDKNGWTSKITDSVTDMRDYFSSLSGDFKKKANRTSTENSVKRFQETITKYSEDQLKNLQKVLQTAKTKGERVKLKGFSDLKDTVLNQTDISGLDKYVEGILKSKSEKVVNKESLEKRKKKIQSELEALDYEKAAGEKGIALRKQLDDIDKKLEVYSNKKKGKSGGTNAQERQTDVERKQAIARQRAAKDVEMQTREAEIKAMDDGMEKKLAQIDFNRDKEILAIQRAYEDLREKRVDEAKKLWDADPNNKKKDFFKSDEYTKANINTEADRKYMEEREKAVAAEYMNDIRQLTSEYQTVIDERAEKMRQYNNDIAAMTDLRNRAEKDGNEEAVRGLEERIKLAKVLRDMSQVDTSEEDYNLNYGTWAQKLQALNSRYQRQIAEATAKGDSGLAKSLQKQWEDAVSELDIEKLKEQINWDVIFGNLSGVSKKKLQEVKKQMDKFLSSPQFKKLSPANQKALVDAFSQIRAELNEKGGIFQGLIDSTKEYHAALDELRIATEEYDEAVKKFGKDSKEAQEKLKQKNTAERKAQNAGGDVKDSLDKTVDKVRSISNMAQAMSEAGDDAVGALSSVFDTLAALLGDKGGWASIVAAILAILDMIGDKGLSGFLGDLLSSIGHAVGGIVETIGNIFGANGWGDIFMGADTKAYDEMVQQYNSLIATWDILLDKKKEYIEMSYGAEAVKASKEAEQIVQKEITAWRALGYARMNAGASLGSHSYGYRSVQEMNDEDWIAVARSLGRSTRDNAGLGGRLEGLFALSIEQLEKLRQDAPAFWAKLDSDAQEYLNKMIDGAKQIEEIQKNLREQLTSTSFDALKSQFADALYDMEGTAADRGKKIKDALFKSIVDNFILGKDFDGWLEGFYKKWADKIGTGTMSSYDWDNYAREYNDMLEQKIAERDRWAASMGYTGKAESNLQEQTATSKAIQNTSQDSANAIEGRITAMQIAVEQGNTKRDGMLSQLTMTTLTVQEMRGLVADQAEITDDIRDLIASSYLELRDINGHQAKIEKVVTDMASDLVEVKDDIKKLR